MSCKHLATGILVRDGKLLMVASRYANQPEPLWNLPGGRQRPGELLRETVERETLEETGLRVQAQGLAYVSESYDGDAHFLNATFALRLEGRTSFDKLGMTRDHGDTTEGDHVVEVAWVPLAEAGERIRVAVVREPLEAYLAGTLTRRYAGFHEAGITIEWPADSQ